MALSQVEKEFIQLAAATPNIAFHKIVEGELSLSSFKDGFYKDGNSLLHTLMTGLINNHSEKDYLSFILYILEHSSITLEDSSRGKSNPLEEYINHYQYLFDIEEISYNLTKEIAFNIFAMVSIKPISDITILSNLFVLLQKCNLHEEYDILIKQYPNIKLSSFYALDLIVELIKRDDDIRIHDLFEQYPALSSDLPFLPFPLYIKDNSINNKTKRYSNEKSNALIYAIYQEAPKITDFFLALENLPLNGKVGIRYGGHDNKFISTHALSQALVNNDFELYQKIFTKIPTENISTILCQTEFTLTSSPSRSHFDLILQHNDERFLHFIIEHAENIIKLSDKPYNFIYEIIGSNTSLKTIDDLLTIFLPHIDIINAPKALNHDTFSNRVFANIYDKKQYEAYDYEYITSILKKLNRTGLFNYTSDMLFKNKFFEDEKLFDAIIEGGLNLIEQKKLHPIPSNILFMGLKNSSQFDINQRNNHNIIIENQKNIFLKIKNILKEDIFIEHPHGSLIEQAFIQNNYTLIDILSDQDILKITNSHAAFLDRIPLFTPNIPLLENFLDRCINMGLSFFNNIEEAYNTSHPFYHLLSININKNILDKILIKENKNIQELSKDSKFWKHINNQDSAQYAFDNNGYYSNPNTLLYLCHQHDFNVISLYLNFGGSLQYKNNDQGNILHELINKKFIDQADVVLSYMPELAGEVNQHNKFPISYFLELFNKNSQEMKNSPNINQQNLFKKQLNFVAHNFQTGFNPLEKKAMIFLEAQLVKYTSIFACNPELITIFNYGMMQKKLPIYDKKEVHKKNKI